MTTWQLLAILAGLGSHLGTTVYFLARMQAKNEFLERNMEQQFHDLRENMEQQFRGVERQFGEVKEDIRELRKDLASVIQRIDRSSYVPKT